jgi:hypothetical protein
VAAWTPERRELQRALSRLDPVLARLYGYALNLLDGTPVTMDRAVLVAHSVRELVNNLPEALGDVDGGRPVLIPRHHAGPWQGSGRSTPISWVRRLSFQRYDHLDKARQSPVPSEEEILANFGLVEIILSARLGQFFDTAEELIDLTALANRRRPRPPSGAHHD